MDSSASGIVRAKSEQLEASTIKSLSRTASAEAITIPEIKNSGGVSLPAKPPSAGKKSVGNSPGRKGGNHHVRKSRSAQLKLDVEDVSSGAALSRASSASLGFSFSFTGFTAPPEDVIADLRPSSDEENGIEITPSFLFFFFFFFGFFEHHFHCLPLKWGDRKLRYNCMP